MKTKALLLLLPLLLPGASSGAADEPRELRESYALESGQVVRIDLPVAELRLEGGEGNRVEVELTARCNWGGRACREALQELRLEARSSARRLALEVAGHSTWSRVKLELEGTIVVPRGASTEVDLGVGAVEVQGVTGDLRVDVGVGDAKLWLSRGAVRTVTLDAGIGDVSIFGAETAVEGRRPMLVGSEIYWDEGDGSSRVVVDVGVGEVSVWLD